MVEDLDYWIKALSKFDDDKRADAAAELVGLGAAAVPILLEALTREEGFRASARRELAARTLGRLGPLARPAVPALTSALADPEASIRIAAADGLGAMGPVAKDAVPQLVRILTDKQEVEWGHVAAARALGRIGPAALAAVPDLVAAMNYTTGHDLAQANPTKLYNVAMDALIEMGPEVLPILQMKQWHWTVRDRVDKVIAELTKPR